MTEADKGAVLRTGEHVDIARARPCDLANVTAFYQRLDDAATYHRFFGIRRQIPRAELERVVGAGADHVTLLVTLREELIGIGEYIVGNDPTEAEVAFAVADDHHRQGIATLLLERLAVIANEHGLTHLTAMVLPDNADMHLVFRTVGLTTQRSFEDGIVHTFLDVTALADMEAAAAERAR